MFVVWTLSFDGECRQQLIDQGFVELLKSFPTDHDGVKRGIDGALWNLDEAGRPKPASEIPQDRKGQVMISYSWKQQDRMRQLCAYLKTLGFLVWMDVEQMEGSVLEKMTEAVEESDVIIIGLSSAYKDSQACRTEAEYAYRLKKTMIFVAAEDGYSAKGWLGALLGNSLWYSPWTDSAGFEAGSAGIVKALGKKVPSGLLSSGSQVVLTSAPTTPATPARTLSQTAPPTPGSSFPKMAPLPQGLAPPQTHSLLTGEMVTAQKEVLQRLESVLSRLQALEASSALHLQLTTSQVSQVATRLELWERTTLQSSFVMLSTPQLLCIAIVILLALLLK